MAVLEGQLQKDRSVQILAPGRIDHEYVGCQFISRSLEIPGEGQLLKDHLLNVSAITSRLAAKAGMPRVGALIGLAYDLDKNSTAFSSLRNKSLHEVKQITCVA
jgi:hypothetical protein